MFFFLKHAGELHIFILRRKEGKKILKRFFTMPEKVHLLVLGR
jgi:hypothetical protein